MNSRDRKRLPVELLRLLGVRRRDAGRYELGDLRHYARGREEVVDATPGEVVKCGGGTDGTERGRTIWARVKGRTENALLALPFRGAYMFRPAFIQAGPGIVSKTKSYRILYSVFGPLFPLLRALFPRFVTTTEELGRAMLEVARHGAPKRVLESPDIVALAGRGK